MKRFLFVLSVLLPVLVFGQKPYKFDHTKVDVGKIQVYKEAKGVYTIENTGKKPLIILEAVGSCGCVHVKYPKKPIAPGKQAKIIVTYHPYAPGEFKKGAFIRFSAKAPYDHIFLILTGKAVMDK